MYDMHETAGFIFQSPRLNITVSVALVDSCVVKVAWLLCQT